MSKVILLDAIQNSPFEGIEKNKPILNDLGSHNLKYNLHYIVGQR